MPYVYLQRFILPVKYLSQAILSSWKFYFKIQNINTSVVYIAKICKLRNSLITRRMALKFWLLIKMPYKSIGNIKIGKIVFHQTRDHVPFNWQKYIFSLLCWRYAFIYIVEWHRLHHRKHVRITLFTFENHTNTPALNAVNVSIKLDSSLF